MLFAARASIAIISPGDTFSAAPRIISTASIPVCPITPGAIAETVAEPREPKSAGSSSFMCRVTVMSLTASGPIASEAMYRLPSPATSTLSAPGQRDSEIPFSSAASASAVLANVARSASHSFPTFRVM